MRHTSPRGIAAGVCIVAGTLLGAAAWEPPEFLGALTPGGRASVERGGAAVEPLPARGGDLGVFGAARVRVNGERLVSWMRRVERLQTGRYASVSRRFSNPPTLGDLDDLSLDDDDLNDLRRCRPGDCGLKLSAIEIEQLRQVISEAASGWKSAAQAAFRRIVLERATRYLAEGDTGAPPYHDHKSQVAPEVEFATVVERMRPGWLLSSDVVDYLKRYPRSFHPEVESFLYWSKGTLGSGKQIISITHVAIFTSRAPETEVVALVASKQVFAQHYFTGSLSLTAITSGSGLAPPHLVYARRSRADVLDGPFGGLIRRLIERRVRAEGPGVLEGLRRRLESGDPVDVHEGSR